MSGQRIASGKGCAIACPGIGGREYGGRGPPGPVVAAVQTGDQNDRHIRHRIGGDLGQRHSLLGGVGGPLDVPRAVGHHLSYWQRKRVAIAGATAMRPRVLLLDEPTAGLDASGHTLLLSALDRLEAAGTTVVLSTHDVDLAWRWADEVALVTDGQVRQEPMAKILSDTAALGAAHLATPWPVALLHELGRSIDPMFPPRTTADVASLLTSS